MAAANEHMRGARLARGLSRPELADAVAAHVAEHTGAEPAIDANYVAKLERGAVRWPGTAYRAALRHVLGAATDADLGLYASRKSTPPTPAPARHSSGHAPAVGSTAGTATATAMTHGFRLADRSVGGGSLYRSVHRFLNDELMPHLAGVDQDAAARYSAAATLTDMCGWMAHDAGDDRTARAHFDAALRLADAADRPAQSAYACSSLAHLANHLGHADDAVRIAGVGLRRVRDDGGLPALEARLHAMTARGHAALSRVDDCRIALDASALAVARRSGVAVDWLPDFDDASLAHEAALCWQRCDNLDDAEECARRVAVLRAPDRVRSRALAQLTLAEVLVAAGCPDEAAREGDTLCAVLPTLTSVRVRSRFDGLAVALAPHGGRPDVAAFLARRASLPGGPSEPEDWPV